MPSEGALWRTILNSTLVSSMEELARVGFVAGVCRRRRLHDGSGQRSLDSGHVLHGASALDERAQAASRVLEVLAWAQAPHVEKAQCRERRPTSDDVFLQRATTRALASQSSG